MNMLERIRARARDRGVKDVAKIGVRGMPMGGLLVHGAKSGRGAQVSAILNTASVDLDDEVLIPSGGDMSIHMKYGAIYYNHIYGDGFGGEPVMPIGSLRQLTLVNQGSAWRILWSVASNKFAQDVLIGIREGIIRGMSVGFVRDEYGPPSDEESAEYGECQTVTRKWRGLESSATPMPCNPDATIEAVAMGADEEKSIRKLAESGVIAVKSAEAMGVAMATVRGGEKKKRRVIVLSSA